MSDSHHSYPQHTQSPSLSASYAPAPLRLPVTYATPTPYTHAVFGVHHTLSSATYPPVSSPRHVDTYRGAASTPTSPQGPLPSVRMLNLQDQPPTTASHYSMAVTSPLSPSMGLPPTIGFFGVPVPQIGYNAYMSPHMGHLFARPSNKKEIKRRTKTGCLTCRKRRIKCDEGRPLCNNCRKSKRDCQGYDHVVKHPGPPTPIQPAPSQSSLSDQTPLISPSSASGPASAISPNTIQSPFGTQPSGPSAYYGSAVASPTSNPALVSPPTKSEPFGCSPADPATHAGCSAAIVRPAQSVPRLSQPTPTTNHQSQSTGYFNSARHRVAPPGHRPPSPTQSIPDITSYKMMRVNEVISSMGTAPAPRAVHVTDDVFKQVVAVYHEIYSPGLIRFFEMPWYSFKEQGHATFPRDQSVVEKFAACLEIFQGVSVTDHTAMGVASLLETQMVWNLVTMAHTVHPSLLPPDHSSLMEVRSRVLIVGALLSGEYLAGDVNTRPVAVDDPRRSSEFEFWDSLWEFLTFKDSTNEFATRRTEALERLRARVGGRENRDILYSLAIIRALAPQYPPGFEKGLPQHRDESDPRSQLWVAIEFLQNEARVSGGVTNVARRLTEVGLRALVNPGVYIRRPPAVS